MLTNKELLTAICESNGSIDEYLGEAVDEMGLNDTGGQVYGILDTYPLVKNQFMDVLTDKILKTMFYSKVFANPLSMLHRGKLDQGIGIEQIFVGMAKKINFGENFTKVQGVKGSPGSEAESLISKIDSDVDVKYITRNFQ